MKRVLFLGTSRKDLAGFSEDVRSNLGQNLFLVQNNLEPSDWKAMPSVAQGVYELRYRGVDGSFRVLYFTKIESAILVLHSFQKKTQKTDPRDLDIARSRLAEFQRMR